MEFLLLLVSMFKAGFFSVLILAAIALGIVAASICGVAIFVVVKSIWSFFQ